MTTPLTAEILLQELAEKWPHEFCVTCGRDLSDKAGLGCCENRARCRKCELLAFIPRIKELMAAQVGAAYRDAADVIERSALGWKNRIDAGDYQGESLRFADIRRDEGVDNARLVLGCTPYEASAALEKMLGEARLKEHEYVKEIVQKMFEGGASGEEAADELGNHEQQLRAALAPEQK